jgi:hypothetical protein
VELFYGTVVYVLGAAQSGNQKTYAVIVLIVTHTNWYIYCCIYTICTRSQGFTNKLYRYWISRRYLA